MKSSKIFLSLLLFIFLMLIVKFSMAQCIASFTYSQGSNGNIQFSSTSTGTNTNTNYYWFYGNGNSQTAIGANGAQVSQTYTTNGVYQVYKSIWGSSPTCTSSAQQTIVVSNSSNSCALIPGLVYGNQNNGQIQFNNNSSGNSLSTTYTLDFGDGSSPLYTNNPNGTLHTYTSNGLYTLSLHANNNFTYACSATFTTLLNINSICNYTPSFTYTSGTNGAITFSSTSAGTNSNTNYAWNFGNNTFTNGINLAVTSNTYYANGTYLVSLGLSSTSPSCFVNPITQSVVVNNVQTPTCNLQASFTYTQSANGVVNFQSNSTGTVNQSIYTWDYGKYPNTVPGNGITTSTGYQNNQSYTVSLTVDNQFVPTCISVYTTVIQISSAPCSATPSIAYTSGSNGSYTFTNSTLGLGQNQYHYWQFGDGNSSGNTNTTVITNTYVSNGVYTVTCQMSSSAPFCTVTAVQVITVTNALNCPLSSSFSAFHVSGGTYAFINLSTGTNSNTLYTWNFGDGTTSNSYSTTHTYTNAGIYNVSLSAVDGANTVCSNISVQALNVNSIPCTANSNFNLAPTGTAQVWSAIPAYPWNVVNAVWNWGDGTFSNQLYTSHTYSAAGLYSVCLSVSVSCIQSSSTCATYSIVKMAETANMVQIIVSPPELTYVGIEEKDLFLQNIMLLPNPNNGNFILRGTISETSSFALSVFDLTGKRVYFEILDARPGVFEYPVQISNVTSGIYLLELWGESQSLRKKLIISNE